MPVNTLTASFLLDVFARPLMNAHRHRHTARHTHILHTVAIMSMQKSFLFIKAFLNPTKHGSLCKTETKIVVYSNVYSNRN